MASPFKFMGEITLEGWALLIAGWAAWTVDGYDFFSVSLTSPLLAKQFEKKTTQISTAITLTLLFRSVGAVIFGILADRVSLRSMLWPPEKFEADLDPTFCLSRDWNPITRFCFMTCIVWSQMDPRWQPVPHREFFRSMACRRSSAEARIRLNRC